MKAVFLAALSALIVGLSYQADAGDFKDSDCPAGLHLLRVETVPRENAVTAAVLVREDFLRSGLPDHLYARNDGWTYLSTEGMFVRPGAVVSNCLPQNGYHVRVEYYERVPLVGNWLLAVYEYREIPDLGDRTEPAWHAPAPSDHLRMHWPLFAVYAIFLVIWTAGAISLVISLRRRGP